MRSTPTSWTPFTLSQFVFQARVNTVDDEGNTIEMTDEEKAAALEEEKAAVKEQAEALQARLEAGEDPEALAEEFSDSLYSSEVALEQMGSTVNSEYSEWAYDSAAARRHHLGGVCRRQQREL